MIPGLQDLSLSLDQNALAELLIPYVVAGSAKNNLSITDLTIVTPAGGEENDDYTVKDLFDAGSDLFSSIIYQKLNADQRAKIPKTERDLTAEERNLTKELLSQMIFIDYFYIFTQARHPTKAMDTIGRDGRRYQPAQFILNTIGTDVTFEDVEKILFAKGLAKMPMAWIQSVPVGDLSTEAQNRFLLGAAGHRLIQGFATIKVKADAPDDVKKIWALLIKYTQDGYSWNFHTAFRGVAFVRTYKSLNKILENLLATYGVEDDLIVAVSDASKALYRPPVADRRYQDYSALLRPEFKNFMELKKIFQA